MLRAALDRARSSVITNLGRTLLDGGCQSEVAVSCRSLCELVVTASILDEESPSITGSPDKRLDWSKSRADYNEMKRRTTWLQESVLAIDEQAPNFSGDAVINGDITTLNAKDYTGKWVVLFFYPKDFTFVCPTEIIAYSDRVKEFRSRNAEVIGASCDSAEVHLAWIRTPRKKGGLGLMQIPLLADVDRRISTLYGVLNADYVPNRGIFLIDPKGKLKSMQINQNDVGRSVNETLRLLDAYQFVEKHGVVCPADWKPGADTMEADPDGSLQYFNKAESSKDDHSFAHTLTAITSKDHYNEVDFMASWCGKCRMISPAVEALQREYPNVTFYKFDISNPALDSLASELGVTALPVFKFYRAGKEVVEQVVGYKKKPLQNAVKALSNNS